MEFKTCPNCGPLSEDNFSWKNKSKGIRASMCKSCHQNYSKTHYANNHDAYIAKSKKNGKKQYAKNRELIIQHLKSHSCVDCGESDIAVLQFDHRNREDKHAPVSRLGHCSLSKLMKEIEKCDIRCANCHMRRTGNQFGWLMRNGGGGETRTRNEISPSRA